MLRQHRSQWQVILLTLLLVPACDKPQTPSEAVGAPEQPTASPLEASVAATPFDDAAVFFELNTTAHDMGFQVFLDAPGWRRVSLTNPNGNRLFALNVDTRLAEVGITELRFESAEPSPAEIRSRFPVGDYTFRGETVEGVSLFSKAHLGSGILAAPTFTPRNGQVVDPLNTVVRWEAPGAEMVEVIIEHNELSDVLDVTVPGSRDRLTIPRQFLRRGQEYKIEILSIAGNGNRTIAESTFRTQP
jgi:hypothetical protein